MGFLFQYDYDLEKLVISGGGKDSDGYPIPTSQNWVFHSKCRDEPNGKAQYIMVADGSRYQYAAIILCPEGTSELKDGTRIRVKKGQKIRLDSTVKNSDESNFHTRIWV